MNQNAQEYSKKFSILIPCKDEQSSIANVVRSFRAELPNAEIIVCDNNSSDRTSEAAREAGAIVISENRQGKGHALRRLFSIATRPYCVMVDGDDTYQAKDIHRLAEPIISNHADMVVGVRIAEENELDRAFRHGHKTGNRIFSWIFSYLLNYELTDVFSGYRVMSLNFVKSFPCLSSGFEIETELTLHALDIGLRIIEIPSTYKSRIAGSISKLRTYRDGSKIMVTLIHLFSQIRPFRFYCVISGLLATLALLIGLPLIETYLKTGLVPRFPSAILASAIMILAALSFFSGMLLDHISRTRREIKRLFFLSGSR